MLTFGPVPSRRLGRSLGINNVPLKVCSYSCVYCQLGPTVEPEISRRPFYPPEQILKEVEERLAQLKQAGYEGRIELLDAAREIFNLKDTDL